MSKLILLQDGQATPFELAGEESIIGRLPDCAIQLASNMVSRNHARVFKQGEAYFVEDLNSGNGTFLNGEKIAGAQPLKHNDRLKFGPMLLRFESDSPPPQKADAAVQQIAELAETPAITIDEQDESSTIMGAVDHGGGYGLLDVRPQEKLKAVLEISRALAGTLEVEKILPKILDTLFALFPAADRGCILLKNDQGQMVPRAMKHRRAGVDETVKLSRTILKNVLEQKQAVLSADAASDSRFDASESISALTIRSMMCAPMLDLQGEPIGVINIDTQNPVAQFRSEDLEIMLVIAGQAALSYEGAKLLQSFVEKQKQDSEMGIARNVQHALLPESMPEVDGYEFFATYEAAQAVGGDYYDVIPLADGKLCLAFGDVAGKGVPASLVMSRMSSAVRTLVEHVSDPGDLVSRINDHMCAKAVEGRFVTFVLTILDTQNHHMWIVNAGHMAPMIRHPDGTIEEYGEEAIGVPIGVLEGFPFDVVERDIHPGETVVIYTDGVSEAMNPASDLYGTDRLKEIVSQGSSTPAKMGAAIRADVKRHAAGRPQNDDITLMVFGRLA
ncbi:MAG: SpoIIE family protein phosphatase [Planctomycetaceae bacterium]|nr:SpoIIE family protein phosphatase [Planctomycetaceae bacterium]